MQSRFIHSYTFFSLLASLRSVKTGTQSKNYQFSPVAGRILAGKVGSRVGPQKTWHA